MKTAKEMFERLGYKTHVHNDEELTYRYERERIIHYIFFDKKDKSVSQSIYLDKKFAGSTAINMERLQAINKQVEELGWKDERD